MEANILSCFDYKNNGYTQTNLKRALKPVMYMQPWRIRVGEVQKNQNKLKSRGTAAFLTTFLRHKGHVGPYLRASSKPRLLEGKVICSFQSVHRIDADGEKASCCKRNTVTIKMIQLTPRNVLTDCHAVGWPPCCLHLSIFLLDPLSFFAASAFGLLCINDMDRHLMETKMLC